VNNIKKIELISIRKEDYEGIVIFLSNFQGERRDEVFWENRLLFWWDNNPAFSDDLKRGWILKDTDSLKIVGFIANIPTFFIYEGKKIVVNNASTWRVEKEYRNLSIKLFLSLINYSKDTILFDTTPSNAVEEILELLKFDKLDVNKATAIPISISEHTTNKYLNKIKLLIPLLNSVLSIFNKLFLSNPKHFYSKIISSNEISTNFDDLWEKTKHNFSNTLLRDSKTIKWYLGNQFSFGKVIICCFKDNEMIGYGIFSINGNIMSLIDFWSANIKFDILKSIATEAFYYGKNNNIKWLYFIHFNNHIKKMFEKLYPYKKKYPTALYYKTKICDLESSDSFASLILGDLGL